jgi:hypothetical protein
LWFAGIAELMRCYTVEAVDLVKGQESGDRLSQKRLVVAECCVSLADDGSLLVSGSVEVHELNRMLRQEYIKLPKDP